MLTIGQAVQHEIFCLLSFLKRGGWGVTIKIAYMPHRRGIAAMEDARGQACPSASFPLPPQRAIGPMEVSL